MYSRFIALLCLCLLQYAYADQPDARVVAVMDTTTVTVDLSITVDAGLITDGQTMVLCSIQNTQTSNMGYTLSPYQCDWQYTAQPYHSSGSSVNFQPPSTIPGLVSVLSWSGLQTMSTIYWESSTYYSPTGVNGLSYAPTWTVGLNGCHVVTQATVLPIGQGYFGTFNLNSICRGSQLLDYVNLDAFGFMKSASTTSNFITMGVVEFTMSIDRTIPGSLSLVFPPVLNTMAWCPSPTYTLSSATGNPVYSAGVITSNTMKLPYVGGYGAVVPPLTVRQACNGIQSRRAQQTYQSFIDFPTPTTRPILTLLSTTVVAGGPSLITFSITGTMVIDLLNAPLIVSMRIVTINSFCTIEPILQIPNLCGGIGTDFQITNSNKVVNCFFKSQAGCGLSYVFRYRRVDTYLINDISSLDGPTSDVLNPINRPFLNGVADLSCITTPITTGFSCSPSTVGCHTSLSSCPPAPVADLLTLYGYDFTSTTSALSVQLTSVNNLACPTCTISPRTPTDTVIVCLLGVAAPSANCAITVQNEIGNSFGVSSFIAFLPAPTITVLKRDNCQGSNSNSLIGCATTAAPLTITGLDFSVPSTVTFFPASGCGSCTNPVIDLTRIVCSLTGGTVGISNCVVIVTSQGTPSVSTVNLSYAAVPTITSVTGSCGSGTVLTNCATVGISTILTVFGTEFYGTALNVIIQPSCLSTALCSAPTIVNANTITCTLSNGVTGKGPCIIYISGAYGGSMTNTIPTISFASSPIVNSLTSASTSCVTLANKFYCPAAASTGLTINGQNFFQAESTVSLTIGAVGACGSCGSPLIDVDRTRMVCTLNAGSSVGSICPVTVSSRGGSNIIAVDSPRIYFLGLPTITTLGFTGCSNSPNKNLLLCDKTNNILSITGTNLVGTVLQVAMLDTGCGVCDSLVTMSLTLLTCILSGVTSSGPCTVSVSAAVGGATVNTIAATISFKIPPSFPSSSSTGLRGSSSYSSSSSSTGVSSIATKSSSSSSSVIAVVILPPISSSSIVPPIGVYPISSSSIVPPIGVYPSSIISSTASIVTTPSSSSAEITVTTPFSSSAEITVTTPSSSFSSSSSSSGVFFTESTSNSSITPTLLAVIAIATVVFLLGSIVGISKIVRARRLIKSGYKQAIPVDKSTARPRLDESEAEELARLEKEEAEHL